MNYQEYVNQINNEIKLLKTLQIIHLVSSISIIIVFWLYKIVVVNPVNFFKVEIEDSLFQPPIDIIEKYDVDNPIFKIILAFVPALLGIAYPLIIQTIGRLNDQYKSTHIVDQFKNEIIHKIFTWNLRISVFLTISSFILSITVFVIAFLSVVILLVFFFLYLRLLLKYQNGKDLFRLYLTRLKVEYYIKHSDKKKGINRQKRKILKYWHPIIDIFLYAIRNNDNKLDNDIRAFFIYKVFNFIKYSDQKDIENVLFPTELYNSTYDIIYSYIKHGERDYYQNIELFVGSVFFSESYGISAPQYSHHETLTAIWRNLVLLIEHERRDKIIRYWGSAHQYFGHNLELQRVEYDDDYNETDSSIKNRIKVEKYRDDFIQLHTALGAYLMYKRDCKTLKEIWFYTQSQPPVYVLLPQTMDNIIKYFLKFSDDEFFTPNIIIRFWFKDLQFDEMNYKRDVKFVVREYLVLLFLRLYIAPSYYGEHPLLRLPQIPKEQSDKQNWIQNLEIFKNYLQKHLENEELMKCLGLDTIQEISEKKSLKLPIAYLDELKQKIEEGFEITLEDSELDDEKIANLDKSTNTSITEVFNDICRIKGEEVKKVDRDPISDRMEVVRGTKRLLNREAFISNVSVDYLNYDSIIGSVISSEYYNHFVSKLSMQHKKFKYKVPNGQLFSAIERLNPDPNKYIILSFGVNIEYQKNYKNVKIDNPTGNENFRFRSIPIYCYDFEPSPFYNTINIMQKDDLPMIKHRDWSEIKDLPTAAKQRWKRMKLINDDLKIYRKITDLNTTELVKNEYLKKGMKEEELKNMLEVDIDFLGYIWFRKNVELIEIKESELFQEGGTKNEIDDIKPLV